MKNIKNLTKIYILQTFVSMFKVAKRKTTSTSNVKKLLTMLGIIALLAYAGFVMYMMYFSYGTMLSAQNLQAYLLLVGIVFSNLLLLFILTFEIHGHFFKHKDYNLVASMPIPAYQVIISKFASILIFSYIYLAMFFLPSLIALIVFKAVSVIGIIFFILGFLFLPFFVIAIGALFALLLNLFLSFLKPNSAITIVVLFALFIGLMALIYFVNSQLINLIIASNGIPQFLYYIIPTGVFYFNSIVNAHFGWFIIYLLASLFIGGLAIFGLALFYNNINKSYENVRTTKQKGKITYKKRPILLTLLKQEFYRYTHSTIYVFNTFFGMIMLLGLSIAGVIFYFPNAQLFTALPKEMLFGIFLALVCTMISLSITTHVSISMEGNTLYVKKSLPISYKNILLAKLLLNIVVCLPIIVLSYLIMLPVFIAMQLSAFAIIEILLVTILALFAFSIFGLVVNLWYPKLNFSTETEVVKQSASVFVCTLGGMAFVGVIAVLYAKLLVNLMSIYFFALIVCALFVLTIMLCYWYLKTKGKQIYLGL